MTAVLSLLTCVLASNPANQVSLTLPLSERPAWLARDGIVMAGSWEPLLFRHRRDGGEGYEPTAEERAGYEREHSPEMIATLRARGVNFVMMHCYKGFGRSAERQSMEDAVRFARLCREAGLRVGVYTSSGTLGWELFFQECPQARDWLLLDEHGQPIPYGGAKYRYYFNRNHPGLRAFQHDLIRFAIKQIQADLLHFDNYHVGPGFDTCSIESFRAYLREQFTAAQLERMGIEVASAQPPKSGAASGPLRHAWRDFSCQWMADSYTDLTRYARGLRKDVLMECNPGGPHDVIAPPIDHGRQLAGGEAFWDEGARSGYRDGKLTTRIRTYKVARRSNNIAFAYTTSAVEAAEAMAFNLDCLGCIAWFEYGRPVVLPGGKEPVSPALDPFIRFFHARRDLLRNASVVADIAVPRSFASQVFAPAATARLAGAVEERCIQERIPFQILYDSQLADAKQYKMLVLAGCVALSDAQLAQIADYVQAGGRLCVIGPVATHDAWMNPREHTRFLDELPAERVTRISPAADLVEGLRKAWGATFSMEIAGPHGLCAELTEQPGRRLVHLVNYRSDAEARDVSCRLRLPDARRVQRVLLADPQSDDVAVPFTEDRGMVVFTVPRVGVYRIAVVEFE